MYKPLYGTISRLIREGETGTLSIQNAYGLEAKITLDNGEIMALSVEGLTGNKAANKLFGWVSVSTSFTSGQTDIGPMLRGVNTEKFLGILETAGTKIEAINKVIPNNNAVFKIVANDSGKEVKFSPRMLKVAAALNGKQTISEIVVELNMTELETLGYIHLLFSKDMAKMVAASKPLVDDERDYILKTLEERIGEFVGPAAGILIQDAFESTGTDPEFLTKTQLAELTTEVCQQIDEEEIISVKKWVLDYLNSLP